MVNFRKQDMHLSFILSFIHSMNTEHLLYTTQNIQAKGSMVRTLATLYMFNFLPD